MPDVGAAPQALAYCGNGRTDFNCVIRLSATRCAPNRHASGLRIVVCTEVVRKGRQATGDDESDLAGKGSDRSGDPVRFDRRAAVAQDATKARPAGLPHAAAEGVGEV